MNKRYAALIAAAVMILGSCGKVDERNDSETVKDGTNAKAPVEEMTTEDEDCIVTDEETTYAETTPEETDIESPVDTDDYDFEQYYNYIIGDGFFGFEMYNDGHIAQSWERRLDGAKVILEGMAVPGTEQKMLDLAVSSEQLNALETEGFMAHMKFEDSKSFRVGDDKIDGQGVTLIGYGNSYVFNINYFDENGEYCETPYFEFPMDYIPPLTEVVQYVSESDDGTASGIITGGLS